jgi:hypothetical protein
MKKSIRGKIDAFHLAHMPPIGLNAPGFIKETKRVMMAGLDKCVGGGKKKTPVPSDGGKLEFSQATKT